MQLFKSYQQLYKCNRIAQLTAGNRVIFGLNEFAGESRQTEYKFMNWDWIYAPHLKTFWKL